MREWQSLDFIRPPLLPGHADILARDIFDSRLTMPMNDHLLESGEMNVDDIKAIPPVVK